MNQRVEIAQELVTLMASVDSKELNKFQEQLKDAKRIFTIGMGRSGFMMRGFAMRLMHMGFKVYVVGETTTPAILPGDLLIIGSGSGETGGLLIMAKKAKELGANIALITANKNSSIAKLADAIISLKAQAKEDKEDTSIQPMGSLFEQGLLLVTDSIILEIMNKIKTDGKEMFKKHANLE